jgi:PAS domain S-box-containing protein
LTAEGRAQNPGKPARRRTPTDVIEERFRTIAENTGDAIVTADEAGRIVYFNRAAQTMFGYRVEDVIGRRSSMLLPENLRAASEAALDRLNLTGVMENQGRTIESVARRKDGRNFPIEFTVTRHNSRTGLCFSFIIRDISERVLSREKLEKAYASEKALREKLEEESRKRVDFSKALVHELKTPLTPVLASTELLMEEKLSDTGRILVKNIQRGATSLNMRIDELLDLAMGEVGQIELIFKEVDLLAAIRSVMDDSATNAAGKSLSLTVEAPKRFPLVEADESRIRQVIRNLLNGAIRFAPEGGNVQLRLRREDGSAVVEVQDNGRGLAPEDLKHIFEAYRRPREERRRLGGLGIGLAVAHILVGLHGGEIRATSEPGKGCLFRISLPIKNLSAAARSTLSDDAKMIIPAN